MVQRPQTYPCNLHSYPPPQSRKRSELFEQRISELILRSATFPGYLGTTSIEPDNLGNRRYVFRFADQESLETWFNSPERRDCLARLDPLTDGIPSYEPVYGEQAARITINQTDLNISTIEFYGRIRFLRYQLSQKWSKMGQSNALGID
jgi:quinol monooxygenase YgiN